LTLLILGDDLRKIMMEAECSKARPDVTRISVGLAAAGIEAAAKAESP